MYYNHHLLPLIMALLIVVNVEQFSASKKIPNPSHPTPYQTPVYTSPLDIDTESHAITPSNDVSLNCSGNSPSRRFSPRPDLYFSPKAINKTPSPDYVCVPSYRCEDYNHRENYGGGVIQAKAGLLSCPEPDVACLPNQVNNLSSPPQEINTTPSPDYVCVPSSWCEGNYGTGIFDARKASSNDQQSNVCCRLDRVNMTSSPSKSTTATPIPNYLCVPSSRCKGYNHTENYGNGFINARGPLSNDQEPNVCCPSDQVDNDTIPQSISKKCGIRREIVDIGPRIIAATRSKMNTSFGEFPWMALILTTETTPSGTKVKNSLVCGASLLSASIVLTAAHCVKNREISSLKVRVGEYNTKSDSTEPFPYQERPVRYIELHPKFDFPTHRNNLALLAVTNPFDLAPHVSPICIPTTNTGYDAPNAYDPKQCIATGWGKDAFDESSYKTILRKVDLFIVHRDQCESKLRKTRLGNDFILHSSFICAGGQPGFDTCQGDGGGPLFCASRENPNQYIQTGVTSWGMGCGTETPGVYASLEANREWLTTEFNAFEIYEKFCGAP